MTMTTTTSTEPMPPPLVPPPAQRKRRNIRGIIEMIIPLLALVLLVVATAVCERSMKGSTNFLKPENILNILRQLSPIGVVALGMTFAIISGGIDLSVGSLVALAGGVGIWAMNVAIKADSVI